MIILPAAIVLLFGVAVVASAQQSQNQIRTQGATHASIHDIVRDISQYDSWKILQYYDKEDDAGIQYYRFKLLRRDGKLVIIDVDPRNPDLRALTR